MIKDLLFSILNLEGSKIIADKLTYLSKGGLYNIVKYVKQVEKNKIPGIFVETGCALGGSTIQIGLVKNQNRQLNVYDVFGQIPAPSDKDGKAVEERYQTIKNGESTGITGNLYYGYEKNLIQKVRDNLKSYNLEEKKDNIHLIQGLYEDSLQINEPVAFAHVDCDWYSSVITSLEQIEPNLSKGGVMIFDDYNHWAGCKKAIDFYFNDKKIKENYTFKNENKKLILIKNK